MGSAAVTDLGIQCVFAFLGVIAAVLIIISVKLSNRHQMAVQQREEIGKEAQRQHEIQKLDMEYTRSRDRDTHQLAMEKVKEEVKKTELEAMKIVQDRLGSHDPRH